MSTSLNPAERRTLGAVYLSCALGWEAPLGARPLTWFNALARLGILVPFFLVQDVGTALLGAVSQWGPRPDAAQSLGAYFRGRAQNLEGYAQLLKEISETDLSQHLRKSGAEDSVMTTLLARALATVGERWRGPRNLVEPLASSADALTVAFAQAPALWSSVDRSFELEFMQHLVAMRLHVLLALEQIDLDTLELLRIFGRDVGGIPETELVDLMSVFGSPEANDVVNFSLDILPSVLETKRGGGQQVFSVDGYSGVVANGSLDSLVLTEMAYDEELFEQRFVDNEMLYYSHEAQVKPPPRSYQVLVDASASMRGARAVFARGLAIALAKRMSLLGFESSVRFFDSRLYEPLRVRRPGRSAANAPMHIAGVLTFKGEHGRNYARVFSQFASELDRVRDRAAVTAYVITHAECHVPVELIRRIRESAELYGIFMLPSRGAIDLEYLPMLSQVEVVTDKALKDRSERANRAISIVKTASDNSRRDSLPPRLSKVD